MNDTTQLIEAGVTIAADGARQYFQQHQQHPASPEAFTACVVAAVKSILPSAMFDAKAAIEANLPDYATATFKASMILAGIEAAKECGVAS